MLARPEAGHLDDKPAARLKALAAQAVNAGEEADVLIDRQPFVQRKPLRHIPDAAFHRFRIAADVDAADRGGPGRRLQQPA